MSSIPKTMYSMLLAVLRLQENKVYHTGEMCVYIYISIYTHTPLCIISYITVYNEKNQKSMSKALNLLLASVLQQTSNS